MFKDDESSRETVSKNTSKFVTADLEDPGQCLQLYFPREFWGGNPQWLWRTCGCLLLKERVLK